MASTDLAAPVIPAPADPSDSDLAARIGAALSRLMRVASRAKSEAATKGVEATTFPLLVALAESGPMRSNALAGAVLSDPSTVSRQVAALVVAGYVGRHADPDDRRASSLVLTDAGHAALATHRRRRDEHLARVLAHWSVGDRATLAVLVDRLATDLTTHLQPTAEPAGDDDHRAHEELS